MDLKNTFRTDADNNERRGVAPIIATLLMVAIAVVGGILIFVFAQGFFNTTSDIAPGGTDALAITGYDARDGGNLKTASGISMTAISNTVNRKLAAGSEYVAIYVRNTGTQTVEITAVEVNNIAHTTLDTGVTLGTGVPGAGEFVLVTGATTAKGNSQIEGGESITILVGYAGTDPTDSLSTGRNSVIKILTANGGEFTTPFTAGERET